MNIIGLGKAGCKIAKELEKFNQYTVFCINTQQDAPGSYVRVAEQNSHEDYEKNHTPVDLPISSDPVTFIMCGSGAISGCALRVLEELKKNKVTVLYVKPDPSGLSKEAKMRDRVTFGVLQQYARSDALEKIYVIDNKKDTK